MRSETRRLTQSPCARVTFITRGLIGGETIPDARKRVRNGDTLEGPRGLARHRVPANKVSAPAHDRRTRSAGRQLEGG